MKFKEVSPPPIRKFEIYSSEIRVFVAKIEDINKIKIKELLLAKLQKQRNGRKQKLSVFE